MQCAMCTAPCANAPVVLGRHEHSRVRAAWARVARDVRVRLQHSLEAREGFGARDVGITRTQLHQL